MDIYRPPLAEFAELAERGNLVPVWRELPADLETPVSVYLKLKGKSPSFLLESVEKGEQLGRYSFLGIEPAGILVARGGGALLYENGSEEPQCAYEGDPLAGAEEILRRYRPVPIGGLPRFYGGLVGYLGYDAVRFFERVPLPDRSSLDLPDAVFLLADTLLVFDHVKHRLLIVANAHIDGKASVAYEDACEKIDTLIARLRQPLGQGPSPVLSASARNQQWTSNFEQTEFENAVRAAQKHIAAGDIFQVVLSQRLSRPTSADPFTIYRALRMLNPSPYMFFLDLPCDLHLIGSSPEMLVRLEEYQAELRPIAGTRPRGTDSAEDETLAAELLADPKERAEHVMLVDLGRNDLGRVCRYGSVSVPEMMSVERYSHVMHIVSSVKGELAPGLGAFDLVRATFPAGTVSGAPKVRAMEIIADLESDGRGPYSGAVGYFGFSGNMDTCITIRTITMQGSTAHVQAGAGIVADSDPTREYFETLSKAQALAEAVSTAERGGF